MTLNRKKEMPEYEKAFHERLPNVAQSTFELQLLEELPAIHKLQDQPNWSIVLKNVDALNNVVAAARKQMDRYRPRKSENANS